MKTKKKKKKLITQVPTRPRDDESRRIPRVQEDDIGAVDEQESDDERDEEEQAEDDAGKVTETDAEDQQVTEAGDEEAAEGVEQVWVCGRRNREDRRIIVARNLDQARRVVGQCRELMAGTCARYWVEIVRRIEV